MDCEKTREELSAYLDGEMEPGEAELIERHLEGCKPCSAELESLRATVGLVRSLPKVEAPAALRGRVFSAVARRPGRVRLPGAFALLTAAALVLVAVVATFMLADRQDRNLDVTVGALSEDNKKSKDMDALSKGEDKNFSKKYVAAPEMPRETEGKIGKTAPAAPSPALERGDSGEYGHSNRTRSAASKSGEFGYKAKENGRSEWDEDKLEAEEKPQVAENAGKESVARAGRHRTKSEPAKPTSPGDAASGIEEYVIETRDVGGTVDRISELLAGMNIKIGDDEILPDVEGDAGPGQAGKSGTVVLLASVDEKVYAEMLKKLDYLKSSQSSEGGKIEEPAPEEEQAKSAGEMEKTDETTRRQAAPGLTGGRSDEGKKALDKGSLARKSKKPENAAEKNFERGIKGAKKEEYSDENQLENEKKLVERSIEKLAKQPEKKPAKRRMIRIIIRRSAAEGK